MEGRKREKITAFTVERDGCYWLKAYSWSSLFVQDEQQEDRRRRVSPVIRSWSATREEVHFSLTYFVLFFFFFFRWMMGRETLALMLTTCYKTQFPLLLYHLFTSIQAITTPFTTDIHNTQDSLLSFARRSADPCTHSSLYFIHSSLFTQQNHYWPHIPRHTLRYKRDRSLPSWTNRVSFQLPFQRIDVRPSGYGNKSKREEVLFVKYYSVMSCPLLNFDKSIRNHCLTSVFVVRHKMAIGTLYTFLRIEVMSMSWYRKRQQELCCRKKVQEECMELCGQRNKKAKRKREERESCLILAPLFSSCKSRNDLSKDRLTIIIQEWGKIVASRKTEHIWTGGDRRPTTMMPSLSH